MTLAISGWTISLPVLLLLSAPSAMGATPVRKAPAPREEPSRGLCDALQALPDARKAQCCGTSSSGGLAVACAQEVGRALREHALALDPADVARCAADSTRALEGCDWVTPYLPRIPASCRGILHGRLEAGVRCQSSLECRDGLFCRGSAPTVPGVCAPPGPPGAACGAPPDTLATYTRQIGDDALHPECAGFCLKGRCAPFVSAGGACAADRQCAGGSHCASGRCVEGPRPTLGEACAGSTCAGELVCVEGHCAPPRQAGAPCTQPFECEAACLSAAPNQPGVCGTKCSVWPPAGYTSPVDAGRSSEPHASAGHPIVPRTP